MNINAFTFSHEAEEIWNKAVKYLSPEYKIVKDPDNPYYTSDHCVFDLDSLFSKYLLDSKIGFISGINNDIIVVKCMYINYYRDHKINNRKNCRLNFLKFIRTYEPNVMIAIGDPSKFDKVWMRDER